MPLSPKEKVREAQSVQVAYENPLTVARRGNLTAGTLRLIADNVEVTLHTVYGAAKRLRRSAVRVQQLIQDQHLRAYKFGRDWLILDADLQDFLKAQKAKLTDRYAPFLEDKKAAGRSERAENIGRQLRKFKRGRTLSSDKHR
jgi:excisionase family DNA binding protein